MKVAAVSVALRMPTPKSIGASVATRASSAMMALRVLVIAGHEVELVVAPLVEPAVDQVIGQPRAPAPLRAHAAVDGEHGEGDAGHRERNEQHRLAQHRRGVLLLDCVEDVAIPDVDPVLDNELQHRDHHQRDGHQPGDGTRLFGPEPTSCAPKSLHQCPADTGVGPAIFHTLPPARPLCTFRHDRNSLESPMVPRRNQHRSQSGRVDLPGGLKRGRAADSQAPT